MMPHFDGLPLRHWHPRPREDGILVLTLTRAGQAVNSLSAEVLVELNEVLARIEAEPPRGLIILSGQSRGFIAGADIHEFSRFHQEGTVADAIARGQRILTRLARLPCPSVAAIHGFCMGGGTELALACRHRIATLDDSTRIGLPEIRLGIIPGWGGSVRLPRLVGAPAAFDMMLSGRSLKPQDAHAIGLVDALCPPEALETQAVRLLQAPPSRPLGKRLLAWFSNLWPARQLLAPVLRKQVARKARKAHYPAPFALIETWRRTGGSLDKRLAAERHTVVKLAQTPTAGNLVRAYLLQERLKSEARGESAIHHVHVIGAGVMGGDIAAWSALKGFDVTLQDRDDQAIDKALDRARTLFDKRLRNPEKHRQAVARLRADAPGEGLSRADIVIEAIVENPDIKRNLYAQAQTQMKADALLTSNTSSIPLTQLLPGLAHPGRFAGLHYFNPVALMPLVEIVTHPDLEVAVGNRLAAFCKQLDKLPIKVTAGPGFLVNRVLFPYLLEAMHAYAEGIPPLLIDKAALDFGMPMGPLELIDTVGLDVAASVAGELAPFLGLALPAAFATAPAAGGRGKKDGQGIYRWENGKPLKPGSKSALPMPDDLQDRLILPMVNEAVACLAEGVVADAELLDAGILFGTGFAPFRGGPIQYIRQTGKAQLLDRLAALQARHGERFAPRPGWHDPALAA